MRKQFLLFTALFISLTLMAQKDELKTAEKEIKNQNFPAAIAAINQAEPLMANADDKLKAKFYFLKGQAFYGNGANTDNFSKAGVALNELIQFEEKTKSIKYSGDAGEMLNKMIDGVAKQASASYESQDYENAAKKFNLVYTISPKDTSYYENAALAYYFAKDHKKSIEIYQELLSSGYTGIYTVYKAKTEQAKGDEFFKKYAKLFSGHGDSIYRNVPSLEK